LTSRRRVAAIAASTACIAASAPVLLRHTGSSDWTDAALGGIVGIALGIAIVFLVVAIRQSRSAS
jgi:uncharacterized membrane protein YccC